MLWLQFIGGGLTEATSVFVATLGGDLGPILSSWFGLYSLCISMIKATVQLISIFANALLTDFQMLPRLVVRGWRPRLPISCFPYYPRSPMAVA
ncbi:unnamed protein product [Ectocarpus sp. 13 AM-2016]